MWLRSIVLAGFCSASLTAHAVDLEAANKAATLVQNAFSCSPPVVVTSSGETTLQTVFEIQAAGDPTWFQVDVISFGTSMRRKDTSASRPIGKKVRYTGRLKDLAFATLSADGNSYLKVTCKQGFGCLNKLVYSQRDDGVWRRSGYDNDATSQVEILSCTERAATALKVGYTTLADFAADGAAPDEAAWKEVRALKDPLSIRQFLASYPGTALASEAVGLLQKVEAEKGPEKEYGKLVEREVATFHVDKATSIYPGPSSQFKPIGTFASGEIVHSSGKISNGRVDDEWLEISFNDGKIGYVERKSVLSNSSYDRLLNYKPTFSK